MDYSLPSLTVFVNPRRLGWVLLALSLMLPSFAQAAEDCYAPFRQGKYAQAASCFERAAATVGTGNLNAEQKASKGRLLRNAALCLQKGAQAAPPGEKAKLLARAVKVLSQYLKEKLYEDDDRRVSTQKLLQQIGQSSLTIVTGNPQAKTCVVVDGKEICKTAAYWSKKLLMGSYKVVVTYPSNPPVIQRKQLELEPKVRKTLTFAMPVKKYGILSVVTNDPRALMTLTGSKLKAPIARTGVYFNKQLEPGNYQLKVKYAGYPTLERNFSIKAKQPLAMVFEKPSPPVVLVNTAPIGARVFVNKKFVGSSNLRWKGKAGDQTIEIKKQCYLPETRKLKLKSNQEELVSMLLQRDPAYLKWLKDKNKPSSGRVLSIVSIIAGVVLAGGGGAMAGLASSYHAQAEEKRATDFEAFQDLGGTGNTFYTIGYVGIGVGVLALGAGVIGLVATSPVALEQVPCQVKFDNQ